jgi:hypothetical protein
MSVGVQASCRQPTAMTMKPLLPLTLFAALLLTGCARHYTLTLNSGNQITALGKPRLENGCYVFKDAKGRVSSVPAGRVKEISPASMVKDDHAIFKPETR